MHVSRASGILWLNVENLWRNIVFPPKPRRYWHNITPSVWMASVRPAGKSQLMTIEISLPIFLFRWTDVFLLRTFLDAANYEGKPLDRLSTEMKWFITFSPEEISDLQKLLQLLDPLEMLFTKLGSETHSSIHLVVPTLLVSIELSLPTLHN